MQVEEPIENHLQIKSIQIIYKMHFCRKIIKKIIDDCLKIKKLIKDKYNKKIIKDCDEYMKKKKEIIETY